MLVDREALEVNVPARTELRLHGARDIDGRLHAQLCYTALHDAELDGNHACHFDGAAEGYLAITLGEVQVSYTELRTLNVDW